jgi:hypothetical protein
MNCIKSTDNQLISGHHQILNSCLNELDKIQTRVEYKPILPKADLLPLGYEDLLNLQDKISSGKGITFECFSDTWFRETKRIDLIGNLWNRSTFELIPKIGCARLIPLNKVWPAIPTAPQFRPITVLCPLLKWLESRFLPKLNNYLVKNMVREQTGFVPEIGTSVNLRTIVKEIKQYAKKDQKVLIFIDYKSAYNTVNSKILYVVDVRVKKKNILGDDELYFLECLHSHIHYECSNEKLFLNNGVPQGSMTSPALFDIYSEMLLEHMRESFPHISMFAYADDLAFVIDEILLGTFIEKLRSMSTQLNLIINESNVKSCAWQPIFLPDFPILPDFTRFFPIFTRFYPNIFRATKA